MFEHVTGWFFGGNIDMKQAANIALGIVLYRGYIALGKLPLYLLNRDATPAPLTVGMVKACFAHGHKFESGITRLSLICFAKTIGLFRRKSASRAH